MREVVIVGAARTPIGSLLGSLATVPATKLGAIAVGAALSRAQVGPDQIGEVYLGCVLPAGVGQAPARQAARYAKIADSVPATTVNKVCGSGLKSVILGAQAIMTGDADVVVAGGMESMSRAQQEGLFADEIVSVEVPQKGGKPPLVVSEDEEPKRGKIEKLPGLRSAFAADGSVTAVIAEEMRSPRCTVQAESRHLWRAGAERFEPIR